MRINLLNSAQDYNPRPADVTWEELVSALTTPEPACLKDDCSAWVPAHFEGQKRGTVNAREVCALVLDCDDFTNLRWQETLARLDSLNLAYAWHTTSSHQPIDGLLRFRVAVKISRPVEAVRWKAFYKVAAPELTGASDRTEIRKIVQTCDPGRIYFVPTEGPHFQSGVGPGTEPLDVEVVFDSVVETNPAAIVGKTYEATRRGLEVLAARSVSGEWDKSAQGTLLSLLDPKPGVDYASPGGRDDALYNLANFVARYMPMVDAQTVAPHLVPGLRLARVAEGESECRHADGRTFTDKLLRALDDQHDKFVEGDPEEMAKAGRSTVYNERECAEFLEQQGLATHSQLLKQLIIQHRSNLYVFAQGDYIYAGSKDNSETLCSQELQPAISLGFSSQQIGKGGIEEKTWKQIFKDHALAVREVNPSLAIRTSYIDRNTKTLWHCIRPRRLDLIPIYDPLIEAWLKTWGDDTLLDWLATAPKLDKATAALFLRGARRSGKTMLAQGLAAVWGKPPTEMDSLKENFNDEITNNPVVFADETVSKRYREDSGLLRRLITATHVTLNRKYMETTKLHGACRVIIAKNNLKLFGENETMTRDDVDALAERILYYHMPHEAPYFHPLRFAQHILWLEDTRKVVQSESDRLWVKGRDSELHRSMRISSRDRSLVCQWIMEMLCSPAQARNLSSRLLSLRDGVSISPRCIYNHWEMYLGKERQLSITQISSVLGEIGVKHSTNGMYAMSIEDIRQWADANSYATDIEQLIADAYDAVRKTAN